MDTKQSNYRTTKLENYNFKYINWMALFMAFPAILIAGLNISVFVFFMIWYKFSKSTPLFKFKNKATLLPMLFGVGAILSVIFIDSSGDASVLRGLVVLPNYLYWCLLVVMLIDLRKYIHLEKVSRYTAIGVIITIVYYLSQGFLPNMRFILNVVSPNSFAFILICFATPCFIYLAKVKKNKLFAYVFLISTVMILITDGRRAGTMLVLVPSILALVYTKIKVKKLLIGIVFFSSAFFALQTDIAERTIKPLNPRIYMLLYQTSDIATQDFSFLVRKLQVEKGLIIFDENPMTGIGLNNFNNYKVEYIGDFEGSELVMEKDDMNNKSAHNSYVSILSEGGLVLLVPLLLLFLYNIYHFIAKYNYRKQIENAYYWSFLGMCIHLYFITAIVNVYAWFLIGVVTMLSVKYSEKMIKRTNIKRKRTIVT